MDKANYRRVIVKLSGEALSGPEKFGIHQPTIDRFAADLIAAHKLGIALGVVVGGGNVRTMSALAMPQVCETYERQRALRHLDEERIIVFAGGTGNPYFTTDTTAILRAAEMGCSAVLKATDVDGVYTADPKKDPNAKRYERLTHEEAFRRELKV